MSPAMQSKANLLHMLKYLRQLVQRASIQNPWNDQLFVFLCLNNVRIHDKTLCFTDKETKSLRNNSFSQGHRLVGFRAKSWTSLPSPLLVTTTQNCHIWVIGYNVERTAPRTLPTPNSRRRKREDRILEKQRWQNTNNHSRPLVGNVLGILSYRQNLLCERFETYRLMYCLLWWRAVSCSINLLRGLAITP